MRRVLEIITTLFYIFIAILVLMVMITIHELGHYIAGKALGFKIKQFSIGFGKALFQKTSQKTGEKFTLRIFPMGGFCEFEGEDEAGNESPQAFNNKKPWKRIIVLLSGAFANFVVSFLIVVLVFLIGGMYFPSVAKNNIQSDKSGNPIPNYMVQESQRLHEGDIILEVGNKFLYLNGDLNTALSKFEIGEEIPIAIVRDGKRMDLKVKKGYFISPLSKIDSNKDIQLYKDKNISSEQLLMLKNEQQIEILEAGNEFYYVKVTADNKTYTGYVEAKYIFKDSYVGLGIGQGAGTYRLPFFETLGKSFVYSFKIAWAILSAFWQLITGQIGLGSVGGITATVDMTAQVARSGFRNLIDIVALIGINLAIFNVLPLPALDGGRVAFAGIEWVRKKPIKREIEAKIHMWGIIVLLGLIVVFDVSYWIIKLIN